MIEIADRRVTEHDPAGRWRRAGMLANGAGLLPGGRQVDHTTR